MIDLIEAYIERTTNKPKRKSNIKIGEAILSFEGVEIGRVQPISTERFAARRVDPLTGIMINPCAEIMQTPRSYSGSLQISDLNENIQREMENITQSYIGRPNNAETTAELSHQVINTLEAYGYHATVDMNSSTTGSLDLSIEMNSGQRSPVTYESSVEKELHEIVGIEIGMTGSYRMPAVQFFNPVFDDVNYPTYLRPDVEFSISYDFSIDSAFTNSIESIFNNEIKKHIAIDESYRYNQVVVSYSVSVLDSHQVRIDFEVRLSPLERPQHAETGFIQVDLTETYEDTLDDQERAFMATQEYIQRTRPVPIKKEEKIDLIYVYNERYKPAPVERAIRPRVVYSQELDMHVQDDTMDRLRREVAESVARAMDRQVMSYLSSIGENEPEPLEPITYSEGMMMAMPLSHREVGQFSMSIDIAPTPIYGAGSRLPVMYAYNRLRTTASDFDNIVGFISTGTHSVRPVGMDRNRFIRMGRDGEVYIGDERSLTYTRFTFEEDIDYNNWELIDIPEGSRWFRMDIRRDPVTSTALMSIVDLY